MPSTESQRRAQKKFNDKHKEKNNARDRKYYIDNCERLKAKRIERYHLMKAQKKIDLANLVQYPSAT